MSKVKAFATGEWLKKDNFKKLKESSLSSLLDFIALDYTSETFLEANSILETLKKISPKGLFVRSGKGSVDLAIYSINIEHIYHLDKGIKEYVPGEDTKFMELLVSDIRKIAKTHKLDTVVYTGSLYHYFRDSRFEKITVFKDKEDIRPYYNFKGEIAIRNFHHGDNKLEKVDFTKGLDAIDFGSGKITYKNKTLKINTENFDLLLDEVKRLLE